MSKKDLFTALIKLVGFSSFFGSVTSLLSIVYSLIFAEDKPFGYQTTDIGLYAIYIVIGIGLMFYGDKIVGFFHIDKGYELDYIALDNLSATDIVKIGVFFMGAMLFVDNLPYTISWIVQRFSSDVSGINMNIYDNYSFFGAIVNLVFGYVMLTNFGRIANMFVRLGKEK